MVCVSFDVVSLSESCLVCMCVLNGIMAGGKTVLSEEREKHLNKN